MRYAYVGCRTTKERNARGEGLKTYEIQPDGSWNAKINPNAFIFCHLP